MAVDALFYQPHIGTPLRGLFSAALTGINAIPVCKDILPHKNIAVKHFRKKICEKDNFYFAYECVLKNKSYRLRKQ